MPAGPTLHRRKLTIICLGLTALLLVLYWQQWFLAEAEQASRDWLLTNTAARRSPENPRIVFLAIDEKTRSLDAVFADDLEKSPTLRLMNEGFPWNREVWAHILDRLAAAGASAVVFDVVFPGPRDGDAAFRAALERHQDRAVIGTNFVINEQEGSAQRKLIPPTPELQPPPGAPSWLGFVNVFPDGDGLVRRIFYRTTMIELTGRGAAAQSEQLLSLAARGLEKAGLGHRIPPTRQQVMFRFCEDFRSHSLHEIFVEAQWNAPPYNRGELFRDKIVLIGASEQASEDRVQTPFGIKTGPLVHLSALNAALNGDFLRETPRGEGAAAIALGGLLAWLLGARVRRPLLRLALLALAILAYQQIAQRLANDLGIIPLLLSPILALTSCSVTYAAWEQVRDRLERQRTRRTLERYVGQDVAREVLDNPASYLQTMGGMRKEIAIFFSDIRGFTTLTESSDPQALVAQLNEYFEEMVGIVFANQGTIDKFIGDAVMAHWGSFVSAGPAADARHAVTTALQMRKVLARLNHRWKQRGMIELQFGMGINQGEAIAGNIGASGAHEKMEFTVIGDVVNLASRLEGVTKQYHIDLCIGESVAALVRDTFIIRSVDLIVVKGKTRPVEVFTVLDKLGPVTKEPPWLARHEEAMRLYRAGDFSSAEKVWREVLEQAPGDGPAQVFLERCAELQKTPPTAPWTGVYEMKSK